MDKTVEFTDTAGFPITVDPAMIKHVARPKGGYPGEVELITGAKWGFGGTHAQRSSQYLLVHAAFEKAHAAKRGEQ